MESNHRKIGKIMIHLSISFKLILIFNVFFRKGGHKSYRLFANKIISFYLYDLLITPVIVIFISPPHMTGSQFELYSFDELDHILNFYVKKYTMLLKLETYLIT